jgi:hypothetical protein
MKGCLAVTSLSIIYLCSALRHPRRHVVRGRLGDWLSSLRERKTNVYWSMKTRASMPLHRTFPNVLYAPPLKKKIAHHTLFYIFKNLRLIHQYLLNDKEGPTDFRLSQQYLLNDKEGPTYLRLTVSQQYLLNGKEGPTYLRLSHQYLLIGKEGPAYLRLSDSSDSTATR